MPKLLSLSISGLAYLCVMGAVLAFFAWGKPLFVVGPLIMAGLAIGSLYALGGIGMVVLYRATGVLNFSSGAAGAAGAMLAWQLTQWGWPGAVCWLIALAVALLITLAYGRYLAPLLSHRDTLVRAVATLGFALIIVGILNYIWLDRPKQMDFPTDSVNIPLAGFKFTGTRLLAFLASAAISVGIWAFLERTEMGLKLRAIANDRDLSGLLGVPILRVETVAWTIAGLIAGFSGLMFANLVRLNPTVVTFMVIPSVAAALSGRLNNTGLVLLGGLSMGVIENIMILSPAFKNVRPIAPFVIAALVLLYHQRDARLLFQDRG